MQFKTLHNMEGIRVKQEVLEQQQQLLNNNNINSTKRKNNVPDIPVIDIASSDDDDSSTSGNAVRNSAKKPRVPVEGKKSGEDVVLPNGFLDPLPPKSVRNETGVVTQGSKQFWKAGDFEPGSGGNWETVSGGMDHVRVHPRFLHSNATSHKWVLGAFAELLDNSLDEVCNGATYVKIDMLRNKKDRNKMLVIEDNGGGMDPDKMRQCMSLGYSLKSKVADTIGQYGNGFKTSTMRLGADVIVFSRCNAKDGKSSSQSIGLLSYTFLRSTGKEDIVVPMLDYEKDGQNWKKIIRSTPADWDTNHKAIVQWSPFTSESELLKQFNQMKDQGTRIIIYNLWEDDQGQLELDFDEDQNDIQIRGVNRDEKNIQMANNYPNSRHFLTYRHSLRSYASILYLRIPAGFRMILRGKDVEHHNIVNDMMITTEITYRPQPGADGLSKDSNIVAVVTMGFVKDAKSHIDVQGYNVYHKNRLIKPFWRLWNAAGSAGRGVIGVLEANFVEPAHDKQGFERTIVLSRLESRLIQMQKTYWHTYCHRIGYVGTRGNKNNLDDLESSPETSSKKKKAASTTPAAATPSNHKLPAVSGEGPNSLKSTPLTENNNNNNNIRDDDLQTPMNINGNSYSAKKSTPKSGYSHSVRSNQHGAGQDYYPVGNAMEITANAHAHGVGEKGSASLCSDLSQLMEENCRLKEKLQRKEEDVLGDLLHDLQIEKNRCKELEAQIVEAKEKCESLNREQESVIDIFADERQRRDVEEQSLRKKLKDATAKIQDLVEQVKQLESEKVKFQKMERG